MLKAATIVVVVAMLAGVALGSGKTQFLTAGSDAPFVVPPGVTQIQVKAWGAAGAGSNAECCKWGGGGGGFAGAILAVSPGETLTIQVGQGGKLSSQGKLSAYPGGGQPGMRSGYVMGGGGGRSSVLRGNTELVVAGGGGGAGGTGWSSTKPLHGGAGGQTGLSGLFSEVNCPGLGATQSNGGAGGSCNVQTFTKGLKNKGGDGGDFPSTGNSGGGGGDGYYGGGAGQLHAGGGGGSSYVSGDALSPTFATGARNGPPGNSGDADFVQGRGTGSLANNGGDGLVIILYDGGSQTAPAVAKQTFTYSGSAQSYTVPPNTVFLRVKLWGAAGAGSSAECCAWAGGNGAFVQASIPVTPGQQLTVLVGGGGRRSSEGKVSAFPNGGQPGTRGGYIMGGGGGRSAVQLGGSELAVAGGGGGAGGTGWNSRSPLNGGGGGFPSGTKGWYSNIDCAGEPGSVNGGGDGVCSSYATPSWGHGSKNQGGNGGDFASTGNSGGGGGDGYYGGGAGQYHAGGGGGASFVGPTTFSQVYGNAANDGSAPFKADPDYVSGVAQGSTNANGGNGLVVIEAFDEAAAPAPPQGAQKITKKFSCIGSDTIFKIPGGVNSIDVKAWGGAGAGSYAESRPWGGGGGAFAGGSFSVTPGEYLKVLVGCGGKQSSQGKISAFPNGGQPGTRGGYTMGGGGGRTALERGSTELLVAAGGGGAGGTGWSSNSPLHGGGGGGPNGQDGLASQAPQCRGVGATQSSGGNGVCSSYATPSWGHGSKNQGGHGGDFASTGNSGGGGGDGYYGGGAGQFHAGGGGGSSYVHPSATSPQLVAGTRNGPAGNNGDVDYVSGTGNGATNADGGDGLLVITYNYNPAFADVEISKHEYGCTNSAKSLNVPAGASYMLVKMWGAAGAGSSAECCAWAGGNGAFVLSEFGVTPGDTLTVLAGCGGRRSSEGKLSAYPNGGKPGIRSGYIMGGGGGRSAVVLGSTELAVAGAGGGAGGTGWNSQAALNGGGGGYPTGSAGWFSNVNCAGQPGTQSSGGAGGSCHVQPFTPGLKNKGGDAGDFSATGNSGGGGGDGYYGGGAGQLHAGGGGGSSYIHGSATHVYYVSGGNSGNAPNKFDIDYSATVAQGSTNANGGSGRVVITFFGDPVDPTPAPPTPVPPTPVPPTPIPGANTVTEAPAPTEPAPTTSIPPYVCVHSCLNYRCPDGSSFKITVVGTSSAALVWGAGIYTDDSDVPVAAVHAGKVAVGETKELNVYCTGAQTSFTGSEANGITSLSYGPYARSFAFDVPESATSQPPQPAPSVCYHEPCVQNKCQVQGTKIDLIVIGSTTGSVWGTDYYTDDSSVGTAAVHLGILQTGQQTSVRVECAGPRDAYQGLDRNGVSSLAYAFWPYSFTLDANAPAEPVQDNDVCQKDCLRGRCTGAPIRIRVQGSTYGYAWGTNIYTDDTTVGLAAVHSGVLASGESGELVATCKGTQTSFTGTTQNGVTTSDYGQFEASYSLAVASAPENTVCIDKCLHNRCLVQGQIHHMTVTGVSTGSAWGTAVYTDDSDVGFAAVHAGKIAVGETKALVAVCLGSNDAYLGTTLNGVTTSTYNQNWPFSYKFFEP